MCAIECIRVSSAHHSPFTRKMTENTHSAFTSCFRNVNGAQSLAILPVGMFVRNVSSRIFYKIGESDHSCLFGFDSISFDAIVRYSGFTLRYC